MEFGEAFPAQSEASEEVQPGEGPLDDPAAGAQAGAVLGAAASDDRLDASRPERAAVFVVVIAAIGEQAVGALAGPPHLPPDGRDAVDERQQLSDVVAVAARQADRERDPGRVAEQMVLGAGSATVNGRRPGVSPLEERGCGCRRPPRQTSRSRPRR